MKKIAFTLAEVLICLVLIGILAAILINNMKFSDFKEKEFIYVADIICEALSNYNDKKKLKEIKNKVLELTSKFPIYK